MSLLPLGGYARKTTRFPGKELGESAELDCITTALRVGMLRTPHPKPMYSLMRMDDYDSSLSDRPYSLPPDLPRIAKEAEAELRESTDYVDGGYLLRRPVSILQFDTNRGSVVLNASDLVDFLQPIVRSRMFDSAEGAPRREPPHVSFASVSGKKILVFIELYFYELRDVVCKKNKKAFVLSTQTTVGVTSLMHWLLLT